MQDKEFIVESGKGLLDIEQHLLQMFRANDHSRHVSPSCEKTIDDRLIHALEVATVGKAKEASVKKFILMSRKMKKISYNDYQEII